MVKKVVFVHPGGTKGRELGTNLLKIFSLALSIPTFQFLIEWRWFHRNRSILKIAAKIEGGVPNHTRAQKKFFLGEKESSHRDTNFGTPYAHLAQRT